MAKEEGGGSLPSGTRNGERDHFMNKGPVQASEILTRDVVERFASLADAYHADTSLAERCETEPLSVLREHGIDIPQGSGVRIVPNTDETYHMVLPQDPNSVLEDESLGVVVGGSTASTTGTISSLPSCIGCASTLASAG